MNDSFGYCLYCNKKFVLGWNKKYCSTECSYKLQLLNSKIKHGLDINNPLRICISCGKEFSLLVRPVQAQTCSKMCGRKNNENNRVRPEGYRKRLYDKQKNEGKIAKWNKVNYERNGTKIRERSKSYKEQLKQSNPEILRDRRKMDKAKSISLLRGDYVREQIKNKYKKYYISNANITDDMMELQRLILLIKRFKEECIKEILPHDGINRKEWRKKENRLKNPLRNIKCPICGVEFTQKISQRRQKYCSQECGIKACQNSPTKRKWTETNREKINQIQREWRLKNRERLNQNRDYKKEYQKQKERKHGINSTGN